MIFNRTFSREERMSVLSQVKSLRTIGSFHARALVQSHDGIEQWHIEVDHRSKSCFAAEEDGHTDELRDGTTFRCGKAVDRLTTIFDELPLALQTAFPEALIWWGGYDHGFRPVLLEKSE